MLKQIRRWSALLFCTLLTTVGVAQTVTVESVEQIIEDNAQLIEATVDAVSEEVKTYAEEVKTYAEEAASRVEVVETCDQTAPETSFISVLSMCYTEIANACSQAFDAIYRIVSEYLSEEPSAMLPVQTLESSAVATTPIESEEELARIAAEQEAAERAKEEELARLAAEREAINEAEEKARGKFESELARLATKREALDKAEEEIRGKLESELEQFATQREAINEAEKALGVTVPVVEPVTAPEAEVAVEPVTAPEAEVAVEPVPETVVASGLETVALPEMELGADSFVDTLIDAFDVAVEWIEEFCVDAWDFLEEFCADAWVFLVELFDDALILFEELFDDCATAVDSASEYATETYNQIEAEYKAKDAARVAAEAEVAAKAEAERIAAEEQARMEAEAEAVAKAEAERKAQEEQARIAAEKEAAEKAQAKAKTQRPPEDEITRKPKPRLPVKQKSKPA